MFEKIQLNLQVEMEAFTGRKDEYRYTWLPLHFWATRFPVKNLKWIISKSGNIVQNFFGMMSLLIGYFHSDVQIEIIFFNAPKLISLASSTFSQKRINGHYC